MESGLKGQIMWDEKQLLIEGHFVPVDEVGSFFILPSQYAVKDNPIGVFERRLDVLLDQMQQQAVYTTMGYGSSIILTTITNTLKGDRELAKQVLKMGEECGILSRGHNCSWKVNQKMMKERMVALANILSKQNDSGTIAMTGDEEARHLRIQYKRPEGLVNREEGYEETIHDPDKDKSVKSTIEKPQQEPQNTEESFSVAPLKSKSPLSKPLVQRKKISNSLKK